MQNPFDLRSVPPPAETQDGAPASKEDEPFKPCCLSLDLEVGKEDGRIHAFGAVRGDTGQGHSGGGSTSALAKLDEICRRRVFHSRPQPDRLRPAPPQGGEARPAAAGPAGCRHAASRAPSRFPAIPHHHLVKHYQDGGLKRGARSTIPNSTPVSHWSSSSTSRKALRRASPDLLAAWHWLTTPEDRGCRQRSQRPLRRDAWRASPNGRRGPRRDRPPA